MIKQIALILIVATVVRAHMEMSNPTPRRSRFNTNFSPAQIDYNMVAPLNADGSNFPCKRYPADRPVATYRAGTTISVTIAGWSIHNGGHCQFSISYNGRDFVAIKTILKNCFTGTGTSFAVRIPRSAPACKRCVLAWSWVNAQGNREYYMNCADIRILNKPTAKRLRGLKMFVANLPGYPRIAEFPPSLYDGSDLYGKMPIISIGPKRRRPRRRPQRRSIGNVTVA